MYISANLPERYGVFNAIRQDNFPFNQTFSQYIELIARIGMHHKLDIIEVIGFIEDGVMGDERLPDIPEGNEPVQFRFKTESEVTQQYYQSQDTTNRQITRLIIMMTLRLSERYGTSLYRIQSKIEAISGLPEQSGQKKRPVRVEKPEVKVPVNKKPEVKVTVEKPKVTIKKKKRVDPAPVTNKELGESEQTQEKVEEVVIKPELPEEIETIPKADDIVSRLEKLTKQGEQLLDPKDDDEDVVVETNPALSDFFQTN